MLCGDEAGIAQGQEDSELAKSAAQNHRCRMISQTKVQKMGDELGVVLSNEVLQAMGVKEGSTLHITQAPGSAILDRGAMYEALSQCTAGIGEVGCLRGRGILPR